MENFWIFGILHNKYLWAHLLLAGGMARALTLYLSKYRTMVTVSLIAVLWEVYEFYGTDLPAIYGSTERFFWDALGDVLGGIVMALIVLI